MTLELIKRDLYSLSQETVFVQIDSYKTVSQNTNLLLVRDDFMEVEKGDKAEKCRFKEIFKVLFIAACQAKPFKNELLVAFYINNENIISTYVLGGLSNDYINKIDLWEVDYQSYLDICELTGESKLSFADFFQAKCRDSALGLNSLLIYEGKTLNFDQQNKLWKEIESTESTPNL